MLNAAMPASATTFPAPGEWLFLTSYVGLAAFLVLDAATATPAPAPPGSTRRSCVGAVAALGGGLLLTPFVNSFPEGGIPLLVAPSCSR